MKILYVAMKYDYGNPARGLSFEQTNFYDCLVKMGHNVTQFDFMTLLKECGKETMNQHLRETARTLQPDLMFCCLFTDELEKSVIKEITGQARTKTFNWFCDDSWRFNNFSRHWAPMFSYVSTTDVQAVEKYRRNGYRNALLTQWACNHYLYTPKPGLYRYDVTFIGQPHSNRRKIIAKIKRAGIDVQCFGYGWENGRLSQEDMITAFSRSKINLNLSNVSSRRFFRRRDQMKGRNFEVPGCGGFLLTNYLPDISRYYAPGKEIACFRTTRELINKIRYYLLHDDERRAIAQAGYERTLREHTYEKRFNELFANMGLV